jgi:hypothetical protein
MEGVSPKPYRFTLIGKQEFIDSHGNKTVHKEELLLDHLPGGWKDYEVAWGMDNKYFGFGTSVAHNITFYKDGANMLRMYYDNFGIDADVILKVEKGNMNTLQYDFEAEFNINFSEYESWQHHVVVGLDERGVKQMLHAKDKNTYDISMNDGQMVRVENGMNLHETAIYEINKKNKINYNVKQEWIGGTLHYVFEYLGMTEDGMMKLTRIIHRVAILRQSFVNVV